VNEARQEVRVRRFRDKVAVITGGSSGIGLATARRLHEEGAELVLFARSETDLRAAAASCGGALTIAGDVCQLEDLARLYAEVGRAFGRVDVLFANAGVAEFMLGREATPEAYARLFDTNVRGAFFTVQGAVPLMKPGSAVVLTTSVANRLGQERLSLYAASKAAVRSMARTWAGELCRQGIRVNAVSPGPTESAIHGKYAAKLSPAVLEEMGAATMARLKLGRMATAEEVAAAVAFLASPEAAFIVGQELVVDGGISAL
jgi:NAD(P)-dependent dehydrogenase (short-subunit alcohol dehydrogenase family)